MIDLDTPALGRKIADMQHRPDRSDLIAFLTSNPRANWKHYAIAYIAHIGNISSAIDRELAVPGVLYIWEQLCKEVGK